MSRFQGDTIPFFFVLLVCPAMAIAGGYFVSEQGGWAVGMGGAFTAVAQDLSSVFYNPAGVAKLKGCNALFNLSNAILYNGEFYRAADHLADSYPVSELENHLVIGPMAAITDDLGTENWTIGLAGFAPYGAVFDWPDWGTQKYMMRYERLYIVKSGLVIGWQATDRLALGANIDAVIAYYSVDIFQDALYTPGLTDVLMEDPNTRIRSQLRTGARSFTADVGLLYDITDRLTLGIHYVPAIQLRFKGDITTQIPPPMQPVFGESIQIYSEVPIDTPQYCQLGLSYRLGHRWLLSGEGVWMDWSKAMQRYEILLGENPLNFEKVYLPKNWKDRIEVRLGVQYQATKRFALRAGFLNDPSPIPDESFWLDVPDCSKQGYSLGLGWRATEKLTLDLSYAYYHIKERNIDYSTQRPPLLGKFRINFDIAAISVSYKFR